MKPRRSEVRKSTGARKGSRARRRTEVEGQNPKADDAPDKTLYHDEDRTNLFDPDLGKNLKIPSHRKE
jgi:hypothetical protein